VWYILLPLVDDVGSYRSLDGLQLQDNPPLSHNAECIPIHQTHSSMGLSSKDWANDVDVQVGSHPGMLGHYIPVPRLV
jgi:hypothetical protein